MSKLKVNVPLRGPKKNYIGIRLTDEEFNWVKEKAMELQEESGGLPSKSELIRILIRKVMNEGLEIR